MKHASGRRLRESTIARPMESDMTVCPIAIAASCRKCPVVGVCPLKRVLGDYTDQDDSTHAAAAAPEEKQEAPPKD